MPEEVKVPSVGESVTEIEVSKWLKSEGDSVRRDESLVVIESDKATMEVPAPVDGVLRRILKAEGETASVGDLLAEIEAGAVSEGGTDGAGDTGNKPETAPASAPADSRDVSGGEGSRESAPAFVMPAAERVLGEAGVAAGDLSGSGPGGRILKEDAERHVAAVRGDGGGDAQAPGPEVSAGRGTRTVRMTPLRRTVARRLVEAQSTMAILTTFNEVDMTAVMDLRRRYRDVFSERHGVKLGFMSFFVKASVEALLAFPELNAEIRGTDIIYHDYCDIGVAIGAEKGLVVPVLRNAERMGFADVEKAIGDFAKRASENRLSLDELQGGTFTISNGGVYGSLLSTPIINPPQSGVLGMHSIQERPVVVDGAVVVRPMMYLALSYDHRIVDGRGAVSFLKRLKDIIEDPARILLEV